VGAYKPYLWEQSTFTKGPMFRDWLLTKAKSLYFKTKTTFTIGFATSLRRCGQKTANFSLCFNEFYLLIIFKKTEGEKKTIC
jgi:hypothetical protein